MCHKVFDTVKTSALWQCQKLCDTLCDTRNIDPNLKSLVLWLLLLNTDSIFSMRLSFDWQHVRDRGRGKHERNGKQYFSYFRSIYILLLIYFLTNSQRWENTHANFLAILDEHWSNAIWEYWKFILQNNLTLGVVLIFRAVWLLLLNNDCIVYHVCVGLYFDWQRVRDRGQIKYDRKGQQDVCPPFPDDFSSWGLLMLASH